MSLEPALYRDRQGRGLGELVRQEQECAREEMNKAAGPKALCGEQEMPQRCQRSVGRGEESSSLRHSSKCSFSAGFQTRLISPSGETQWGFISKRKTNGSKKISSIFT